MSLITKDEVLNQLSAVNFKENALNIRFKADFKNSIHHLSAIVVFLPRLWKSIKDNDVWCIVPHS